MVSVTLALVGGAEVEAPVIVETSVTWKVLPPVAAGPALVAIDLPVVCVPDAGANSAKPDAASNITTSTDAILFSFHFCIGISSELPAQKGISEQYDSLLR